MKLRNELVDICECPIRCMDFLEVGNIIAVVDLISEEAVGQAGGLTCGDLKIGLIQMTSTPRSFR